MKALLIIFKKPYDKNKSGSGVHIIELLSNNHFAIPRGTL